LNQDGEIDQIHSDKLTLSHVIVNVKLSPLPALPSVRRAARTTTPAPLPLNGRPDDATPCAVGRSQQSRGSRAIRGATIPRRGPGRPDQARS
jgi:hypothetical protein